VGAIGATFPAFMADPTPLLPSLEDFRLLAEEGRLIPVFTQITADFETPLSAYCRIRNGEHSFLLESAESSETIGRYSFLGSDPRLVITQRGREVTLAGPNGRRHYTTELDPLGELQAIMERFRPVDARKLGLPLFSGGAVGYLGFDCVRYFEPSVGEPPPDVLGLPDAVFLVTDSLVIFDHLLRRITVVANVILDDDEDPAVAYERARGKIDLVLAKLDQPLDPPRFNTLVPQPEPGEVRSNTTREEFHAMVARAKEFIHAGDIFQVVPSQRFSAPFAGDPVELYRALRHVNPSPYMFLLEFPNRLALVGSSPEVHVRCIDGKIEIRPIAGTRWRGTTPEADDALAAELLADPKERAEHLMLVDLARNDVGRIACFDSVKVRDFMVIERYSHVMHIVSHVEGRLQPGRTAYDVMRATFPAGTVSGAPKVRAVQVLYELEKHKRCIYAGAVGYFGFDGNHDSCITLRTCVLHDGAAYVQAGAGVVADSDPEYEFNETVNKARGMLRAIETARRLKA
jgi:anthranilate synthase component I